MKSNIVKNMMVSISEYATVSEEATLYETVMALEKAQQEWDRTRYPQRAVLVYDKTRRIVGKVSQFDVIRALEPKYSELEDQISLSRFGYSPLKMRSLLKEYNLWNKPLNDICRKAAQLKVKTFMYAPTEGEFVDENATLDEAIHQLIMGRHQSLLVTRGKEKEIVGILRKTDVFSEIAAAVKSCNL
jgi:CBS domain-containing protein